MSVRPPPLLAWLLLALACDGKATLEPPTPGQEGGASQEPDDAGSPAREAQAPAEPDDAADAASDAQAASDAERAPADAGPSWPLGMNDVTFLIPPAKRIDAPDVLSRAGDLGADGSPLLPRALYDRLDAPVCYRFTSGRPCAPGSSPVMFPGAYERLHLVAVRFDLCDRKLPQRCPLGADGSMRLVFQPMVSDGAFFDASLHVFYAIPQGELSAAIAALRALARIQAEPISAPLKPSPALSTRHDTAYAEGLRSFVRDRARAERLIRVAINAQPIEFSQVRWILRGLDREPDGSFKDRMIAGTDTTQDVISSAGFEVTPSDPNPDLAAVSSNASFNAADAAQKNKMLEALLAVDNPLTHTLDSVTCAACHTATPLNRIAGSDLKGLSGGYQSSYDLSVDAGLLPGTARNLRMLGYQDSEPMIARRVTHETAQVLSELAERFP